MKISKVGAILFAIAVGLFVIPLFVVQLGKECSMLGLVMLGAAMIVDRRILKRHRREGSDSK